MSVNGSGTQNRDRPPSAFLNSRSHLQPGGAQPLIAAIVELSARRADCRAMLVNPAHQAINLFEKHDAERGESVQGTRGECFAMSARGAPFAHQFSQRSPELPLRYSNDRVTKFMQTCRPFTQAERNLERRSVAD